MEPPQVRGSAHRLLPPGPSLHHHSRRKRNRFLVAIRCGPKQRVMARRRWIADTWTSETATLSGDQAAHLARVLRATPGQVFDVVAGGFLHRAEIITVTENEVVFTLHEELESDVALPLHLLLAIFKFDHMEWAIEKATELGVARIRSEE